MYSKMSQKCLRFCKIKYEVIENGSLNFRGIIEIQFNFVLFSHDGLHDLHDALPPVVHFVEPVLVEVFPRRILFILLLILLILLLFLLLHFPAAPHSRALAPRDAAADLRPRCCQMMELEIPKC